MGDDRPVVVLRTRVRVVEAAAVLFSERGYAGTTLQAIADDAGVSVETVGLAGPKRELLRAAFEMSFAGSAGAFPVAGEPAYVALASSMEFPAAVEEYVRVMAAALARTAGLWRAFQAAADADPKAAVLFAQVRKVRKAEFTQTARWLADRGVVPVDAVDQLAMEFFAIASHEVFLVLQEECGLEVSTFAERLREQLFSLLRLPVH